MISTYKKGGIDIYIPPGNYGIRLEPLPPYKYPKGHPCCGCPFTLDTNVPSCMFPKRPEGSCFWYDQKQQNRPQSSVSDRKLAAKKIFEFIEVLEAVKRRKGYRKKSECIKPDSKGGGDIYDCK